MRAKLSPPINRPLIITALLLAAAALTLVLASRPTTSQASVSVNPAQRFQRIDGFGVNANPKNWLEGDLGPAIDPLVDDLHTTLWRVDVDGRSDWLEAPDAGPSVYERPDFQALWRTLAYLDRKGVRTIVSASGTVPDWMGGTRIDPANEDDFAAMLAGMVDYGRRVRHVPITLLSPLNEVDIGPPEGPSVPPEQYARIVGKVVARLDALGYSDVQIVGPETSHVERAPDYLDALLADPSLAARVAVVAAHDYAGSTGGLAERYPDRPLWMTEWSQNATDGWLDNGRQVGDEWRFASVMTDDLLSILNAGASAALAWDAYDNVHEHCGCTQVSRWGLLAQRDGVYTPKPRYATVAQVFRFVPVGWYRVGLTSTDPALKLVAFADASAEQQLTLVGHNPRASEVAIRANIPPSIRTLHFSLTTHDRSQATDVIATDGALELTVPGDAFFTLTTLDS